MSFRKITVKSGNEESKNYFSCHGNPLGVFVII